MLVSGALSNLPIHNVHPDDDTIVLLGGDGSHHQLRGITPSPVTANQEPVGEVTNTMGATQGSDKFNRSLMMALPFLGSPIIFVEALSVIRFSVTTLPESSTVRQLTTARKKATGLVPLEGGVGITRFLTST